MSDFRSCFPGDSSRLGLSMRMRYNIYWGSLPMVMHMEGNGEKTMASSVLINHPNLIITNGEKLIRLMEVPKLNWLPGRKQGERINISTIIRWAQKGLHGIKLETLRAGGTLVTSEEAIKRFFERLSDPESTPITVTPTMMRRAHKAAARELDAAGA
jgi:hypothetical protein